MANLSLATILLLTFDFPKDIIFYKIYPGIVLIIFLGNLIMTVIGVVLNQTTGRTDITAMPYGLDAPTTISMPLIIVGPLFISLKQAGVDPHNAAIMAWQGGMAAILVIGLFKIVATPFANAISRIVPLAGLLGSLAGIGVMIGIFALMHIFALPLIGIISLGFVLYILIAKIPLPRWLPALLIGIVLCTAIYHILGQTNLLVTNYKTPVFALSPCLPIPTLGALYGFKHIAPLLPVVIPFGILVTIGDINVTVSAVEAGDPYKPRSILLLDGINTLIGAFCGSITQTTAYAGQPAYKLMGAKMGYTLYIAIFMGVCGFLGIISFIIEIVPTAIFAPILIFVAIEIVAQGFCAVPKKHLVASAFAIFPSALKPSLIFVTAGSYAAFSKLMSMSQTITETYSETLVLTVLVNGFILTGMLWGGLLAELIDRHLKKSAVYLFILAVFTFFGIVHSTNFSGTMYLPWNIPEIHRSMCYDISMGYLILGVLFLLFSFSKHSKHVPKNILYLKT
jgi:adenine/guanine/hypoxanthine permease